MEVQRECPVCGETYQAESTRLKFGRQTTCSRACSYRLRAGKLEKQVELICATCGEKFSRSPAQIKGKHGSQFCSSACHYKGRATGATQRIVLRPYAITEQGRLAWADGAKKTRKLRIERNNYRHTDATRAILSEKTAQAIAEGRVPTSSKLEQKVAAELDRLGIRYTAQVGIRAADGTFCGVFDFMLPGNIALEVNGTFWHCDPRFYPDGPAHEIQKRNAVKWAAKMTEATQRGIRVVEVWEYDIKVDAGQAVAHALGSASA